MNVCLFSTIRSILGLSKVKIELKRISEAGELITFKSRKVGYIWVYLSALKSIRGHIDLEWKTAVCATRDQSLFLLPLTFGMAV